MAGHEIVDVIEPDLGVGELLLGRRAADHRCRCQFPDGLQPALSIVQPDLQVAVLHLERHRRQPLPPSLPRST
jgi:hypothetical protein